jgi:prepilin peptidase CpaA
MLNDAASAALVLLLVTAAVLDVRTRRIPNLLTMSGLAVGLALRLSGGVDLFVVGLIGVLVAFVLMLPFLVLGVLGGGDGKLLMAMGAFMGARGLVGALLVIALVGGLIAVVDAGRKRMLLPVLYNTAGILGHWATFGRRGANRSLTSAGALAIPYGVAIAVGGLLWWFLKVRSL